MASVLNTAPMPVIVGAPRSGTTLLRFMLDSHPDLAIPPETGFLALGQALGDGPDPRQAFFDRVTQFPPEAPAWLDFGITKEDFSAALAVVEPFSVSEGCRTFYRLYAARFGKSRVGDKTPLYCQHLSTIADLLPEIRVIHLIRDGRDVALSLRQTWFSPGNEIETLAEYWVNCLAAARRESGACGGYLEVRFEDLVADPAPVLRQICRFLDLEYSPAMLAYHARAARRLEEHRDRARPDGSLVISHEGRLRQQALTMEPPRRSRAGAWRHDMTDDEQRRFDVVAGDLLDRLGYGRSDASVT
jgi:Sulfotransferase family